MKILTKEIIKQTPDTLAQRNSKDPTLYFKLFAPWGNWTWYVSGMDKDQDYCFGYVIGFEKEWGYFRLKDLMRIRGIFGLGIERDLSFTPCKFSELKEAE